MKRAWATIGLVAMGAVAMTGCGSTRNRLQSSISQAFEEDPNAGTVLCGYQVQGLSGITVTNVQNNGSSSSGTGTASVTGTPIPFPGMQPMSAQCTGTVAFRYDTVTTGRRVSYSSRGRRTTTRTTAFRVWDINLTSRAPVMPNGMPAAMPGAMPNGMPGAMPYGAPGTVPAGMPSQ